MESGGINWSSQRRHVPSRHFCIGTENASDIGEHDNPADPDGRGRDGRRACEGGIEGYGIVSCGGMGDGESGASNDVSVGVDDSANSSEVFVTARGEQFAATPKSDIAADIQASLGYRRADTDEAEVGYDQSRDACPDDFSPTVQSAIVIEPEYAVIAAIEMDVAIRAVHMEVRIVCTPDVQRAFRRSGSDAD